MNLFSSNTSRCFLSFLFFSFFFTFFFLSLLWFISMYVCFSNLSGSCLGFAFFLSEYFCYKYFCFSLNLPYWPYFICLFIKFFTTYSFCLPETWPAFWTVMRHLSWRKKNFFNDFFGEENETTSPHFCKTIHCIKNKYILSLTYQILINGKDINKCKKIKKGLYFCL